MDTLSRDALDALIASDREPHVSIFMPTHSTSDTQQDIIRLRKLLDKAEERLAEGELRSHVIREMMDPAWTLLESGQLAHPGYHSEGLALFIARSFFRHYHVPTRLEEQVVLGEKFTIEPLLPLLDETELGSFYILALSLNAVKLLRATHRTVVEVELPKKLPTSLAEAMRYDDFEMQHQYYSGTPGRSGGTAATGGAATKTGAVFYGQGAESDLKKDNVLRYFQQIDRGLHPLLRNERVPMVLAGVEYLQPIYRQANTYAYLLGRGIRGNPDEMRAEELRDEAWPVVLPLLKKSKLDALDLYMQLAGTGQTCADISDIVPASIRGQVDTLFVVHAAREIGEPSKPSAEGEPPDSRERDPQVDRELLNLAAVYTLLNHGSVYVVEPCMLPNGEAVAAILRY